jgi:hypothetical protein
MMVNDRSAVDSWENEGGNAAEAVRRRKTRAQTFVDLVAIAIHPAVGVAEHSRSYLDRIKKRKLDRDRFYRMDDFKLTLLPPFAHKEAVDDDLGLPQHPIYSNFSKYLWTSHTKSGGVQIDTPPRKRRQNRTPR